MNYGYSRDWHPPAPVVEVTFLTTAENRQVGPLIAMLDSGADGTLVPLNYLEEIRAPVTSEVFIRSQWG